MSTIKRYAGLTIRQENKNLPWHAQIARKGITFSIGNFATPDEAARAYDNVAYYTTSWSARPTVLNFPKEWEDTPLPMSDKTQYILGCLEAKFPEHKVLTEDKNKRNDKDGEIDVEDRAFWNADRIQKDINKRQSLAFVKIITLCRAQKRRIVELEQDLARLKRAGMAPASVQVFQRVGKTSVKLNEVEKVLQG